MNNTTRKLASIRKIDKIIPIKGADFIELGILGGWQVIIKKGEFLTGDLGVFFEIDSMLPLEERYSFLKKATIDNTGEGYRLKTMKMRKQLSQGLMLPMNMFADVVGIYSEGSDLTEQLGVWLYEPKMKQGKESNGTNRYHDRPWPKFLPKTDQERIQNKMHYFNTYQDMTWEVTTKLDGSSMTIWNYDKAPHILKNKYNKPWKNYISKLLQKIQYLYTKPDTFGVCSRNLNLRETEGNAFWKMANKVNLREALKGHNIAIQGELIAPNIQDNHEQVNEPQFHVFDIFDIDKQKYMLPLEREKFLDAVLPTIGRVPLVNMLFSLEGHTFDSLQRYVTGPGMNSGVMREGYVFKSNTHPGLSFKCISNTYLLKYQ